MKQKDLDAMLDELVKDRIPEEILGESGLVKELTKRLVERALEGEMTAHLGYERHAESGKNSGNSRNGKGSTRVLGDTGTLEITVPRDRNGDFEPKLISKRQRRLPGFDDNVIALYARGMTTREIQGHLKELCGVEVSPVVRAALDRILAERPGVGSAPFFPSRDELQEPISRHLADAWLRKGEKLAELEPQRGSLWHAYRRKWATERKHFPDVDVDVAEAGGWKTIETLKTAYQQADPETMLRVVLEAGELREAR